MMQRSIYIFFIFSILISQNNQTITFSKDVGPDNSCGGFQGVRQTSDDGYIISGYKDSFGDSGFNFWLIKTDLLGNLDWQRSYGGTGDDRCFHALQAADGGYIITGYSNSNTNSVPDIILIKTDDLGNTN